MEEKSMDQECCSYHHILKKIILAIAGLVLVVLGIYLVILTRNSLKDYNYIGKSPEFKNIISVEGSGKGTAKPDVSVINAGVLSEKNTVTQAQKENTEKMNAIIKTLKNDFKIEDKDIKTSQYSIYPRYAWSDGSLRIIGYSISQAVEIKVRDFDKIGNILAK